MKHTIKFIYDGGNNWGFNGGAIIGRGEVIAIIGKDAFYEALKHGDSFRVNMEVTIEPIGE